MRVNDEMVEALIAYQNSPHKRLVERHYRRGPMLGLDEERRMKTSEAMRLMIAEFEGLRLEAYRDAVGVLTIGYGHTGKDVRPGQRITADEADRLLAADLERFERAVESYADRIEQHQFDALVSFAYNLGEGALKGSTLLKLHNTGEYNAAAREFQRWNHAGGRVLAGLTRRREAKAKVYGSGDYA